MTFPDGVMVFDVESVGLHGEAFAVAWVRADCRLNEVGWGALHIPIVQAEGDESSREWVRENVSIPAGSVECESPRVLRDTFWAAWTNARVGRVPLLAECLWPVEANFLSRCIADATWDRGWDGPYPFHDIASIRLTAGFDPLAAEPRLEGELPAHDPLADARQSLRLLREAVRAAK